MTERELGKDRLPRVRSARSGLRAWKLLVVALLLAPVACSKREGAAGASDEPGAAREASAAEQEGGNPGREADEVKLSPGAVERSGIKVEPVGKHVLAPTLVAPARVSFNTEAMAHVGSAVAGRVLEVKVRVGDAVQEGDELLVVASPELGEAQSDHLQKRTAAETATTTVEPLKNAYERGRSLYEQNKGIALAELQRREAELKAAQAAVRTARAALAAAEDKLRLLGASEQTIATLARSGKINARFSITAPISATVIERRTTVGELVAPEKESLLVLADMTTLWLLADVPDAKLGGVAVGSKAFVKIASVPDETLVGTVSFIAPSLDPGTRSAQVRIEVSNGNATLRPGMFAQAEIQAPAPAQGARAVVAVPERAVMTIGGKPAVFVPKAGEQNTFKKRTVVVAPAVGGMAPILSGLKDGERVVTEGAFVLKAELGKGDVGEDED